MAGVKRESLVRFSQWEEACVLEVQPNVKPVVINP